MTEPQKEMEKNAYERAMAVYADRSLRELELIRTYLDIGDTLALGKRNAIEKLISRWISI